MTKEQNSHIDVDIDDIENYRSNNEVKDIKQVILSQYEKCCNESSKQMTAGGIEEREIDGQIIKIVVPNQIEIFCNSVETLKIMLVKEIKDNQKLVGKEMGQFESDLRSIMQRAKEDFDVIYNKYPDKSISLTSDVKKGYEIKKAQLYRELLRIITFLLSSKNYFGKRSDYDILSQF